MPAAGTVLDIKLQGAAAVEVRIRNIEVSSYSSEVVMDDDGMTPRGFKIQCQGTGLVPIEDWSALQAGLQGGNGRLLHAYIWNGNGTQATAPSILAVTKARSNDGGPYAKLSATQVIGTTTALVTFDIHTEESACVGGQNESPLVSHTWVQTTSLDDAGYATRTVRGRLRVARAANADGVLTPASNGSWNTRRPYADLFRRAVMPDVAGYGWRRISQEFAYDQTSLELHYAFTDKQHAHDLPDGVIVGDCNFSYERTAQDQGLANITFSADLTADIGSAYRAGSTPNRTLVAAAVQLSRTRINANFKNIIVTRMRVEEREMMSRYAIRFEMEATVVPRSSTDTAVILPLGEMIGQSFLVKRFDEAGSGQPRFVDAYGPAVDYTNGQVTTPLQTYAMVPHYIDNLLNGQDCDGTSENVPYATAMKFASANIYGAIDVTVGSGISGIPAMNAPFDGTGYNEETKAMTQPADDADGYTQMVGHSVSTSELHYASNFVRLTTMYMDGADFVFQIRKPKVRVVERIEVASVNKPPTRRFRPFPADAYVIREDWTVTGCKYDSQGQRIYSAIYEREIEIADSATGAGGFSTVTSTLIGGYRAWINPYGSLNATLVASATDTEQTITASALGQMGVSTNVWKSYPAVNTPQVTA